MPLEVRAATIADVDALIANRRNRSAAAHTLLGDALADSANQFWFVLADDAGIYGWVRTQLYAEEEGVVSHGGWWLRRLFIDRDHRDAGWDDALWTAVAGELDTRQIGSVYTFTLGDAFDQWGFQTVAVGRAFIHPDVPGGLRRDHFRLKRADAPYTVPSP